MTLIENLETIVAGITPAVMLIVAYVTIENLIYKKPLKMNKEIYITNKENLSHVHIMLMEKNAYREEYAYGTIKFKQGDLTAEKTMKADTIAEVLIMVNEYLNSL